MARKIMNLLCFVYFKLEDYITKSMKAHQEYASVVRAVGITEYRGIY